MLNLFFLEEAPANFFFLKLIKRKLHIFRFVQFIYQANLYLPASSTFFNCHERDLYANFDRFTRDTQNLRMKSKQVFPFSADEDLRGNNFLEKVGCGNNTVGSATYNLYPCFCKTKGYTLQEKKDQAYISNFKQAPKGCTAIHKYLFYNNGSVSIYV